MGRPSRIGIATSGYRTGNSSPDKICIATHGYRCPDAAPPVDRFDGDGGHGAVILDQLPPEVPSKIRPEHIALAIIAIEETYD